MSYLNIIVLALLTATMYGQPNPAEVERAKNVVLMIGDGMGLSQISAAMYRSSDGLSLEEFQHIGMIKTHSSDDLITDSAAGATAFACGRKTYNGAIGVDADTVACQTLLEEGEEKKYATGLIASSTIVHATPASFVAHVVNRNQYEDIAAAFLDSGVDYFVGGGAKYFNRRNDERNLLEQLDHSGYKVGDYFNDEFEEVTPDPRQNYVFLTADDDPLPAAQGRDYLVPATTRALEFLPQRSEEGFFLMVEGSQIDWGGHANNTNYIITELEDFDRAIASAMEFAKQDGETLLIVTADHECGGFALNPGTTRDSIAGSFTTDYHTASMVPVFTYGPGAELFRGVYDNTAIYDKIRAALDWNEQ